MSFIRKFFSKKSCQEQKASPVSHVFTHEDGEFVNICHSKMQESERDEDADVSKWEMAQVLGNRPNATIVSQKPRIGSTMDAKVQATLRQLQKYKQSTSLQAVTPVADNGYVMEDSVELDMFDDKRNRIIKRSHRRQMNFPEKSKF